MYVYLHVHSSVGYFVSDRKSFSQPKSELRALQAAEITAVRLAPWEMQ